MEQLGAQDPTISGWNVGLNSGEAAGQTVFHAHWHLIPRRDGDCEQPSALSIETPPARRIMPNTQEVSPAQSKKMSAIRRENTTAEIGVRRIPHALGLRFRLHIKRLPGTPDIILPKHQTVIIVHGCFWHRHEGCRNTTTPKTRRQFGLNKFRANAERDRRNLNDLILLGWRVLATWECELHCHQEPRKGLALALKIQSDSRR